MIRMALIHKGGRLSGSGSLKIALSFIDFFKRNINAIAAEKPNNGENNRAFPIFIASVQFTPALAVCPGRNEKARPTPRSEPIKVCELLHGMPKYQVNKFHPENITTGHDSKKIHEA